MDYLEKTPDSGVINYDILNSEGDAHYDFIDKDDENDHVNTENEQPDNDGNGYPDNALDTDTDTIANYLDRDDDGDGLYTDFEDVALPHIYPQDGNPMNDDTDGDGTKNYLDADDDNDGIPTINEHPDDDGNHEPNDALDTDGDGIPDYLDNDDFDQDGINDNIDIDDDNDGILDVDESNGIDPLTDHDGDHIPVFMDDDDNNPGIGDTNGVESAFDADGDGVPNHFDYDSDSDGLWDAAEAGYDTNITTDNNSDGKLEGDVGANGLMNYLETTVDNGYIIYTVLDTDVDAIYNFLDTDDDNDHIKTTDEHADDDTNGYPNDALDTDNNEESNYIDRDDDGDGLYTDFEDVELPHNYPQDGNPMNDDTDGDGTKNYLDADDDNDGIPTINEHPDDDGNHEPNDALDTDGDGIPDYLDPIDDRELIIYTAISPNGNGQNDFMLIENIDMYPKNRLLILNRWQNTVWEGKNYNNDSVKFEGKATDGTELPAGTYYYLLEYQDNGKSVNKSGFLYIIR